ncbi:1984_t:CDS:1, partial [Acaulospora colombiana]
MDKLPNEIWSSILVHFAVLKNMFTWHNIPRTEYLVPLTRVSKRWRNFLHAEPILWNVIILKTRRYDNAAIVARQLQLSAHLPITLVLHLPFTQWNQVLPELIKHRERIEVIALDEESYLERRQSSASVRKMLEDLFPLPHLRQLGETYEAMRRWQDLPYILERFPSLRQLPNIPLTTELLRCVKHRLDLKEVTTYEDLLSISGVLEEMPGIKRVTCQTDPVASLEDFADPALYYTSYHSSRRLEWTRLTFDTYSYPLPVAFLHRLPFLTSLEIRSDFPIFKAVISIAYQFPSLNHFRASISLTHNDVYNPPDKIVPNSTVRSLEIYMFAPWDMAGSTAGKRLSRGSEIISGMILRAMPASERITLSTTEIPHSFKFFELEGWSRVEDLFIFCSGEVGPTNNLAPVPKSVRFLSISSDEEVLSTLSSAGVESLCCMAPYRLPSDPTNGTPILTITATMWPVLQTLEVYSGLVCWDKSSINTLKTVKIINRNAKLYVDNGITSFIHTIACQPDSYPSLEEIEMDE